MIALLLLGVGAHAAEVETGTLPRTWATGGPDCTALPRWQVREYNPGLTILRQSGCTHYEKPFLYLIKGSERAMLIDTGAGKPEVAGVVRGLWPTKPLVVTHSHGHGDHIAGDAELAALNDVTVVGNTVEAVQKAFGIEKWPEGIGRIDLGGRVIEVVPIPGHNITSVAYYDAQTGIVFSGDSVYPGRLYVDDYPAFKASNHRLVEYTRGKTITHILGAHIEQSRTPFVDYVVRTTYQPDEHDLALGRAHLLELEEELQKMGDTPRRVLLRSLTIYPRQPRK